jgi:cytochrome c-type biogenesis protein CcmH
MTFWIIASIIAVLATAPLVLALMRNRGSNADDEGNTTVELRVYKDQLSEVERDLSRGMLSEDAARRARLEISRRMLEADGKRDIHTTKDAALPVWAALLVGVVVLGGGVWLYTFEGAPGYRDLPLERRIALAQEFRDMRPSQAIAEQDIVAPELDARGTELLGGLRDKLKSDPDNLEQQQLMAMFAYQVERFKDAYTAQERVIALKGDAATADDYAALAEMLILAAGSYYVSPEAEKALSQSLARDPENGASNYYAGLMFAQTDSPDKAFSIWNRLLKNSASNDPWVPAVRGQIEDIAWLAGVRYTLPPLASPLKGPTADDVEAAADMDEGDRMEFIRSMVDQLSARLANDGGSAEEWARLISSLGVLGDTSRARAIWSEAQVIFGPDANALATVRAAAQSAGIAK